VEPMQQRAGWAGHVVVQAGMYGASIRKWQQCLLVWLGNEQPPCRRLRFESRLFCAWGTVLLSENVYFCSPLTSQGSRGRAATMMKYPLRECLVFSGAEGDM
jgi:hypothetical protein